LQNSLNQIKSPFNQCSLELQLKEAKDEIFKLTTSFMQKVKIILIKSWQILIITNYFFKGGKLQTALRSAKYC
jgi:hypothetical protein